MQGFPLLPYRYHRNVCSKGMSVFKHKLGKIACFYTPPIEVIDGNDFDEGFKPLAVSHCPLSTAHYPLHNPYSFGGSMPKSRIVSRLENL